MLRVPIAAALVAPLLLAACSGGAARNDDGCGTAGTISVGAKPWAVGIDDTTHRLYAANEFDNTVSVVDLCTHAAITTLPVGIGPLSIAVDEKTGRAFVVDFTSNDVTVIQADKVVQTIPVGDTPWDAVADPDAGKVYVANSQDGTVGVIDEAAGKMSQSIPGFTEPWGLAQQGRTLYVADAGKNSVVAVNLDTLQPAGSVAVGTRPQGMAIDATANRLYVVNTEDATVSVVDLAAMNVVATIPVGLSPFQVAVDPQAHRAYTADSFADTVTVIDTQTEQPIATAADAAKKPWDVKVSADGLYIYVASSATGEIRVFKPDQLLASPTG